MEEGKVQVAGLIQEQHPDRCRLFMQWHQMDWPVLVDSLNLLGFSSVPMTFLIDEHGIIRNRRARPGDLAEFLSTSYPAPQEPAPPPVAPDLDGKIETIESSKAETRSAADWTAYGDWLFLRGAEADLMRCVEAYRRAADGGGPPEARFRLGVALRRRSESSHRQPGDFQASIDAWLAALDGDPDQYIWRRRIQQYGPRPDKPYPFYTWVKKAREEITRRGDEPSPLCVEPSGAELAGPGKTLGPDGAEKSGPDPEGRIRRDSSPLINLEITVAPSTDNEHVAARAYLSLRPNEEKKGHWNNEAGDTVIWLDPPEGVRLDDRSFTIPKAAEETSTETRRVEFEAHYDGVAMDDEPLMISGYVLYYVCEDVDGECLYLRRDFLVKLRPSRSAGRRSAGASPR